MYLHEHMTNPDALWEDMARLNSLYEELGWGHDDELRFVIEKDAQGEDSNIAIHNHSRRATKLNKQINGKDAIHPQDG